MPAGPRKRSLVIAGHATSLSLEDAFWDALHEMAAQQGCSIAQIITAIDADRGTQTAAGRPAVPLSSAVRVHVLKHYRDRIG